MKKLHLKKILALLDVWTTSQPHHWRCIPFTSVKSRHRGKGSTIKRQEFSLLKKKPFNSVKDNLKRERQFYYFQVLWEHYA
jgi:hypothetical protein